MNGGGLPARGGFEFQDLVLGVRVVRYLSAHLAAQLQGQPVPAEPEFYVESRPARGVGQTAPDWDLIEEVAPGTRIFEEVKGGAVGKADRTTLWIRVRQTVGAYGAADLVPRLTVNQENLPVGIAHFRGLSAAATKAPRPRKTPVGNVTSARKLAEEALFWLTRPTSKKAPGKPVSIAEARALLARFDLRESPGRDSLRATLDSELAKLTRSVAGDVVLDAVHGELSRRAADPDETARRFRPTDLLAHLALLSALLRTSAAAIHLWADLRARTTPVLSALSSPLDYQDWRLVQPEAATAEGDTSRRKLAFVGRGGVGKSVLLEHLAVEQNARGRRCILVDGSAFRASTPATIAEAIALGRFAATHDGVELTLLVDSLESSANTSTELADIVAALGRAEPDVRIVVGARLSEWRGLSASNAPPPGWSEALIAEWSLDRVRAFVVTTARPVVTDELVQLLATPLFLDLFLRLFGKEKPVPPGLQTRHGLLREYWDQRVLPEDHPQSPARRRVLDQAASEEAGGRDVHSLPLDDAADRLVSEGIFRVRRGLHVFRHALLRDYALMGWLLLTRSSAVDVASSIAGIPRLLVRIGALRAVLEALADRDGEPWPLANTEVAQALTAHDNLRLLSAEAFAELDDPSTTDLVTIIQALGADGTSFFERLVEVARHKGLRAWAQLLVKLPARADFAEAETWISARGLELVSDFAETIDHAALGGELARLVRAWCQAARFQALLDANDAWLRARVVRVVAARAPDTATFAWLEAFVAPSWRMRTAIVDALPALASNQEIETERLRTLFVRAAGFEENAGRLRPGGAGPAFQFDNALRALTGGGKRPGLLRARPDAMLPVALGLLAGRAGGRAAGAEADPRSFEDVLRGLSQHEYDELDRALEAGAPAKLAPNEAFGDLALDVEEAIGLRDEPTWALLVADLRERASRGSASEVQALVQVVEKSVSLLARLLVLRAATERLAEDGFARIVDKLLADERLYFFRSAAFVLHRALHARWPAWDDEERRRALERLRRVLRRPSAARIYDVAPLLVALPESDWPPDLAPLVEAYRRRFGDPTPFDADRRRPRVYSRAVPADELFDLGLPTGALPEAKRAVWRELSQTVTRLQRQPAEDQTAVAAQPLVEGIERASQVLPAPNDPPRAIVFCAGELTAALLVLGQRGIDPGPAVAQAAGAWCIALIQSLDPAEVHADRFPVGQGLYATSSGSSRLEAALRLMSVVYAALDEVARGAFWTALERVVGRDPAPQVVRSLATQVSGPLWATEAGRRLYRGISGQVTDGDALAWTLRIVGERPDSERAEIFEAWILRQPPITPIETLLSSALGQSMVGGGRVLGALRDRLLAQQPTQGLLAAPSAYGNFLGGVALGCAEGLELGGPPEEIAAVAMAGWAALQRAPPESGDRPPNFALIVFRAVGSATGARAAALWRALEPLARVIVQQGPLSEVSDLLFDIGEPRVLASLGARALLPTATDLAVRLAASPPLGREDEIVLPSRATGFAGRLGCDTQLREVEREQMLDALQTWGAPPLAWPDAVREALRVRQSLA